MGAGKFISDDHYIYYCGQESLRRKGLALIVNESVQNTILGCNLRNNRIVSVHLQSKPLKITVIHSNIVLTANVREDKIE